MRKKDSALDHFSYNITTRSSLADELYGITDTIREQLEDIFFDVGKGKKSTLKRLQRLCKRYPRIPHFKNYLAQEYLSAGNPAKSKEINDWILETHPNYLYGRLKQIHILLEEERAQEVPAVLDNCFDLKSLYTEREEFHIDEVLHFHSVMVSYFVETGDREQATLHFNLLLELEPDSPQAKNAQYQMMMFNLQANQGKFQRDKDIERIVTDSGHRKPTQTDKKPDFHHPETDLLYDAGFGGDEDLFEQILELPAATLARDLEAVLEDAINRHEVLQQEAEKYGWKEEYYSFSIHAVNLLAAIKSTQSLPAVLELLRQGRDFLDYWYADRLEELFIPPVSVLAEHQTDLLDRFMKEPNQSHFAKNIAVCAAEQIALRDHSRRDEIAKLFGDWIQFFLDHEKDDRLFDTTLLGFICWSALNLKARELLKPMQTLYKKNMIPLTMLGTFEDVEHDMLLNEPLQQLPPYNFFDYYSNIARNPPYSNSEPENMPLPPPAPKNNLLPGIQPEPAINPYKDVGRNDPCPCGSGRKYKKCCLR